MKRRVLVRGTTATVCLLGGVGATMLGVPIVASFVAASAALAIAWRLTGDRSTEAHRAPHRDSDPAQDRES